MTSEKPGHTWTSQTENWPTRKLIGCGPQKRDPTCRIRRINARRLQVLSIFRQLSHSTLYSFRRDRQTDPRGLASRVRMGRGGVNFSMKLLRRTGVFARGGDSVRAGGTVSKRTSLRLHYVGERSLNNKTLGRASDVAKWIAGNQG